MSRYRPIGTCVWSDDKFPYSSDDCQLIWFHVFTNPLSTPIGLFKASLAGLAEEKNLNGKWPVARYKKAFEEALAKGFLRYDKKTLLIYFPKFFSPKHTGNHPQSPNVVKSWGKIWNELPESPLKYQCYQDLKALLKGFDQAFIEAFNEGFPKAFGQPLPIQEQEQEQYSGTGNKDQEQEQEQEKNICLVGGDHQPVTSLPNGFKELWDLHPGPKGSRVTAAKAYSEVKPPTSAVAAMQAQVEYKAACDKMQAFCAPLQHLHRWIKQRRWEDEIPPLPKPMSQRLWDEAQKEKSGDA